MCWGVTRGVGKYKRRCAGVSGECMGAKNVRGGRRNDGGGVGKGEGIGKCVGVWGSVEKNVQGDVGRVWRCKEVLREVGEGRVGGGVGKFGEGYGKVCWGVGGGRNESVGKCWRRSRKVC